MFQPFASDPSLEACGHLAWMIFVPCGLRCIGVLNDCVSAIDMLVDMMLLTL